MGWGRRWATGAALWAALLVPRVAEAALSEPGFRAVGVAYAEFPISALAVAPDGRLFAAVQALGQTVGTDPGTAEIRVYTTYSSADGSILDRGTVWATIDNVRATSNQEGVLGLALAPDFDSSKLVYVYLTTTDEEVNQHVRVYRENAAGVGEYVGTVKQSLEPPTESAQRSGGGLRFGVDGCLYVGVGDNGANNRWNAQLLAGTEPITANETTALCTNVCLGAAEYPDRTLTNNGAPNHAGKVLRLAVDGGSEAQPGVTVPLPQQPFVFGTGLRNPVGLASHPLTGQLFAADRGEATLSEVDLVESGGNQGWPCVDGAAVAGNAACLGGLTPNDVYANHPGWRRPVAVQAGSGQMSGPAVYSGLAYPEQFFGDLFYALRDGTRIYRLDLTAPCFLPDAGGMTALPFHDSAADNDFRVTYDFDQDGDTQDIFFGTLVGLVQGPDPLGRQILYVAGKQGDGNGLTEDSAIFRIEYATAFTPYAGPLGRVADSCFDSSGYANPFHLPLCSSSGGVCAGAPDGTDCGDGDACNGQEQCQAGVCLHGAAAADGTACTGADNCHEAWSCRAGACVSGAVAPDGTSCGSGDPCDGRGTCAAGVCQPGGSPEPLDVRWLTVKRDTRGPRSGSLRLAASIRPPAPIAPSTSDDVTLQLREGADLVFTGSLTHPASDPQWGRSGGLVRYRTRQGGGLTGVALQTLRSGEIDVQVRGKGLTFPGLDDDALHPRLVIGAQCFAADLTGRCQLDAKKIRCQ